MSIETELQNVVGAAVALNTTVQGKIDAIDAKVASSTASNESRTTAAINTLTNMVTGYIANAAAEMPVTPNLLADTKYWSKMCKGQTNTEMSFADAHGGPWGWFWYEGGSGTATAKVVTLDKLAENGCAHGGDLSKAASSALYGSNFNVLVFDVNVVAGDPSQIPLLFAMNQGCPTFTGWGQGEFKTQASVFVNVIEQVGDVEFYAHQNSTPSVIAKGTMKGQGWKYLQASQLGFGGCHQPVFRGAGHMKVAIALPYWSYGDHKGKFVYANSVGRYSHGTDYLPTDRAY